MKHEYLTFIAIVTVGCSGPDVEAGANQAAVQQTIAPPATHEEGAVYDVARDRIVLFGGASIDSTAAGGYVDQGDTWEWDGSAWRVAVPAGSGPGARYNPAMVYDPVKRVTVLYGGAMVNWGTYASDRRTDTWTYDGQGWTRGADGPAGFGQELVYDTRRENALMLGHAGELPGPDSTGARSDGPFRVTVWRQQGDAWVVADTTGPMVTAKWRPAFDARRGVVVLPILSGSDAGVWEWDNARWRRIEATGPAALGRYAITFDERLGHVVMFGGETNTGPTNEAWSWDGASWRALSGLGTPPSVRRDGALIYDPKLQRTLMVGGIENDNKMFREIWQLDVNGWRALQ